MNLRLSRTVALIPRPFAVANRPRGKHIPCFLCRSRSSEKSTHPSGYFVIVVKMVRRDKRNLQMGGYDFPGRTSVSEPLRHLTVFRGSKKKRRASGTNGRRVALPRDQPLDVRGRAMTEIPNGQEQVGTGKFIALPPRRSNIRCSRIVNNSINDIYCRCHGVFHGRKAGRNAATSPAAWAAALRAKG